VREPPQADRAFAEHRSHLFGVAYRMLGSVTEAEDVVQEVYLRWSAADRQEVRSPVAYLTTVTTRMSLDRLRSAQARRETYVGPWLPEPLLTEQGAWDDPTLAAELSDSLSTAFLVLLERLNPFQRAVFLLHDVFRYGYEEIATIVDRPASSCRQEASRARARVAPDLQPRVPAGSAEEQRLVLAFAQAATAGDLDGLIEVLSHDVTLWSDGGADRHAARRPVVGRERVARFVANLSRRTPAGATFEIVRIGGDPAILVATEDGTQLTLSFAIGRLGIRQLHAVVNPDKLRHLRPSTKPTAALD